MAKRRCENCTRWSSTDQVWGDCTLHSERDRGQDRRAYAAYVDGPGDVRDAELRTKWDFGCVCWESLASLVNGMCKTLKAGGL